METNKIYLGDSYELIKQLPDKSVDLIYTDIPYLIEHGGGGASPISKRITKQWYGVLDSIRHGIDYSIFDEFCRVLKHIYCFIWCSKEQILDIMNYFVKEKGCRMNILVWCKTNPTPATNGMWLPDIEYCLVFKEDGCPKYADGYELKSKWYLSPINKGDKDMYGHPTIKPLELVKRHIKHALGNLTGDGIVLDPFLGSGTTAVASKELGYKYIGFEIDENYYKIACDRLNGIQQNGQTSLFDTDYEQLDLFKE